jgi:ribonucleotide reductase beta subunit family protein with ferritin-like domain
MPDDDIQLLKLRDDSNKMKKAHEERMLIMAFEFHEMVRSRIYVMALETTLSI